MSFYQLCWQPWMGGKIEVSQPLDLTIAELRAREFASVAPDMRFWVRPWRAVP